MRPYLAIVKDSFRAAFASRVLYVLLALITVLLILIAPFHYREVLDWKVKREQHVPNPALLVERLIERKDDGSYPEVQRIWSELDADLQKDLIRVNNKALNLNNSEAATEDASDQADSSDDDSDDEELNEEDESDSRSRRRRRRRGGPDGNPFEDFPVYENLIDRLNELIQDPEFYQEEDWEERSLALPPEATEYIEMGTDKLSEDRSRRLNRILIGEAFGSAIENGASTSLDFYYAIWKIGIFSTNSTHQQFANSFSSTIPWFFDKFVMSIGLFVAILVTANIIPETFDPGSLNLLLSKPVSRWGLLAAKFFGGCAFVALCALYLFFGVWLWLGFGMGIWDRGILFAIPVYMLVFAIYYSVSTFFGIWYRSAILSVVLTALFWALCFGVGFLYARLDTRMQNGEIVKLVPVADSALQVDTLQSVYRWDTKGNAWDAKLEPLMAEEQAIGIGIAMFMGPLTGDIQEGLGPIFDSNSNKLISGMFNVVDPSTINQQKVYVSDVDADQAENNATDDLNFVAIGRFPRNTVALLGSPQGPLVVSGSGDLYRFKPEILEGKTGKLESESESESSTDSEDEAKDDNSKKSSVKKSDDLKKELFDRIGSTGTSIRSANYVDLNHSNNELAVYRRGALYVYEPDGDGYRRRGKLQIDTGTSSTSMNCRLAYQGDVVTLVLGNGQVITVDANSMTETNGYLPETRSGVRKVTASPDGRWVMIVYRNEFAWLLDNQNPGQINKANVGGQGTISYAGFDEKSRLWIADRTDQASLYDLTNGNRLESYTPDSKWYAMAYRYVLGPLYKAFPKPGELYKVVTYLSSSGDTKYNRDVDLTNSLENKDPFGPLWSGLGFMCLVLFAACVVFHFKDF